MIEHLRHLGRGFLSFGKYGGVLPLATRLEIAGLYTVLSIVFAAWVYDAARTPTMTDNQHYFYVAERAASGVSPHISSFDPKHHASSLITAGAIRIGRVFGVSDPYSARAVSLAAMGLTIGALWLLAVGLTRNPMAGHMAVAAMLSFSVYLWHSVMGAQPKIFLLLFMSLAMLATHARRPFWIGVTGITAYLCWQPGLIVWGVAIPVLLVQSDRWKNLGWLMLGSLATILIYESYFLYHGSLAEQWFQAMVFPAEYMSHQKGGFPGLRPAWDALWQRWTKAYRWSNPVAAVAVAFIASCWIVMLARPKRATRYLTKHPDWIALGLGAHGTFLFTYYDSQGPPDFFFILPYLALAFGMACGVLFRLLDRKYVRVLGHAAAVAVFAWSLHVSHANRRAFHYKFTLDDQYALAEVVKQWQEEGRAVFVVRCTHLLALEHMDNFLNYGFIFPGLQAYLTERGMKDFDPARGGRWPDLIVVSRLNNDSHFGKWLHINYRLRRAREFERQWIGVFQKRRSAPR